MKREVGFDLIVSRWCFRHLADPLGTFQQTLNLLNEDGYFLVDGFYFTSINKPIQTGRLAEQQIKQMIPMPDSMNIDLFTLMETSGAGILMRPYDDGRSLNHFIIHRPKGVRLKSLAIDYSGEYLLELGLIQLQVSSAVIANFSWQVEKPVFLNREYFAVKDAAENAPGRMRFYAGDSHLLNHLDKMNVFAKDFSPLDSAFTVKKPVIGMYPLKRGDLSS